ncbi:MAG TPA: dihydrodipicolinate synthase family protein [Bryobacteraceae bacterium]|nr:dihydrodipicolinate synthase family protein [Bryobacteraceae bacterium]
MTRLGEGVALGAMAAVIAPRRENGHAIDISLALDIVDFVNERGVKGVAVLGATGEFIHYDIEERMRLASMAVRRSRTPVIVNVSHSTLEAAVLLARNATELGAAALLLMPPHFFRHSQEGIIAYYAAFARQTQGMAPTLLYNLPFFTNGMEPATACAILETGAFAGIKDSSGNVEIFDALHALRQRQPFRLLLGNDRLLASHRALADGVISGCASGIPELIVAIDRAATRGDQAALERRGALLDAFIQKIDPFPTPFGIQLTLAARGFAKAAPPLPLGPTAQAHADAFAEWFRGFEVAMRDECSGDN